MSVLDEPRLSQQSDCSGQLRPWALDNQKVTTTRPDANHFVDLRSLAKNDCFVA